MNGCARSFHFAVSLRSAEKAMAHSVPSGEKTNKLLVNSRKRQTDEANFSHGKWQGACHRGGAGEAAAVGSARRPRADRYQIWLWDGPLRLLYGSPQRRRGPFLRHSGGARRGEDCDHDRRALARFEPPSAAGLAGDTGPAMRLLSAGTNDVRRLSAGAESEPVRRRY